MLEKIKEVPFIAESSAVRLYTSNGKLMLERSNKVLWARENSELAAEGINCYVEADKFFALYADIASLSQGTCLDIVLKNGGKYQLPFLDVSWDVPSSPEHYTERIEFKIADLMLCTLKNLIKPELQCIYIDNKGAVTCDFVTACISTAVKSVAPFLLPPDVQDLVCNSTCDVQVENDKIFIRGLNFEIVTSNPVSGGDAWWEGLRTLLDREVAFVSLGSLPSGLKRLSMFADYITFKDNKVYCDSNFEPFEFNSMPDSKYEIVSILKLLETSQNISEIDGNLILKNNSVKFIVSAMELGA